MVPEASVFVLCMYPQKYDHVPLHSYVPNIYSHMNVDTHTPKY